jgi:hypothetical protein
MWEFQPFGSSLYGFRTAIFEIVVDKTVLPFVEGPYSII